MVRLVGGPPVILKLISGTHGKGVMLGRDIGEIQASLETVWALNQVIEVNSGPGFEGFERATGINAAAEILRYALFRLGL